MIRTIVLDDEWYNLEEVCELVEKTGFMQVAGKYMNPIKALEEAPPSLRRWPLSTSRCPSWTG